MAEAMSNNQNGVVNIPQDLQAEAAILSAMMIKPDFLGDAMVQLDRSDFYSERNRVLFDAFQQMFNESLPMDVVSVSDWLRSHDLLTRAGSDAYLAELAGNTLALASWEHHVEILKRQAILRKLIYAASEITALASSEPSDTKEVVDRAETALFDITNQEISPAFTTVEKGLTELYADLQEQAKSGRRNRGIQTGYKRLDNVLMGMQPGQMIVVGARPSVGKTSLALNLAVQAAEQGASVAFFSLEMSTPEIMERILASRSQVPLQVIHGARIRSEQWPQIMEASETLSRLDVMIDDAPGTTVTEIRAKARRMLRDKPNGLIIIDYLQLLASGRNYENRVTEVTDISRAIKLMAKDLGVPVIALSQLRRPQEATRTKTPQLSDLRESGAIEQDADVVVLLDRSATPEEAARPDRPDENVTNLLVAKNRQGPVGFIEMVFLAEYTRFMELERGEYEDAPPM